MIRVSPRPLKVTWNWVVMPWPKAMRSRIESVPQNRAKVMSAAFFRRFRYSLQKKRGRVRFMLYFLRASMGSVEAAVRAGIIPATTPMASRIRTVETMTTG